MNKTIIIVIVIVVIIGGAVFWMKKSNAPAMQMQQSQNASQTSPTTAQKPAGKNAVTIQNFAYSPATITVKAGESVTWTNQDSAGHSATADDSSFDTGVLPQGESKSLTFAKAGTYTYHCSVHPSMKATVIVQ